jgi:predicted enzyme related to lactoylglutathione lyase
MDPVVHFEIPVSDLAKARSFYGSLFGWSLMDHPMPDGSTYVGVVTTPPDEKTRMPLTPGAINGGMMVRTEKVKAPTFAVKVASIEERIRQAQAAGGKLIQPKMDLGIGFYAYIADPDGNVLGLWEDAKK